MKRLLPLVAFLVLGTVSADAIDALNLDGMGICPNKAEAYPDTSTTTWLGDLKDTLKSQVDTRLAAYKVTKTAGCTGLNRAYVSVHVNSTAALDNGARALIVVLDVIKVDSANYGIVTIWQDYNVVVSGGGASGASSKVSQVLGEMLDSFAADYNSANP